MKLVKKLSLKSINVQSAAQAHGAKVKLGQAETETVLLARIYGICIGVKTVTTEFGDSNKLIGEFEAWRPDGETFSSNVAYLPGGLEIGIVTQLARGASSVAFAYDIFAEADKTLQGGYKYVGATAMPPQENDALGQMRKALVAAPAPAPAQLEAAPETVAAPVAEPKKGKKQAA